MEETNYGDTIIIVSFILVSAKFFLFGTVVIRCQIKQKGFGMVTIMVRP